MKKDKQNKPKKEKIIYIDDNSTIADMSNTRRTPKGAPPKQRSTFKEKMRTYFSVVKKMILPMLVTLLAMTIVFIIFMALAGQL